MAASSTAHARKILEAQTQDAGINIIPTPEVGLHTLLDMSIAKTPPFDATGRGFRDAVILETIVQHARGRYQSVLLIAADKDFADTALTTSSKRSGVLIRRARDIQHAVELINEKFFDSLRSMIQAAQAEVLPLLYQKRELVLQDLRRSLQPSEELLKGGAQTVDGGFFWAIHQIDRILGYRFGEFTPGSDFPPLLGLYSDERDRIAVEMKVNVDFDLLVSAPTSIDKPRYSLPDSGDEARPPNQFGWDTKEMSVARDVSFVVSFLRRDQGKLDDLRLERCDGKRVEPTG